MKRINRILAIGAVLISQLFSAFAVWDYKQFRDGKTTFSKWARENIPSGYVSHSIVAFFSFAFGVIIGAFVAHFHWS